MSTAAKEISWNQRALDAFPAGSNGEYGLPADMVVVLERGEGCLVWDAEGREYIDFTMAWGSALVGHARTEVIEAAREAALSGANFASVNRRSVELAERLRALCPCAEQVRFTASGTEATLLALRIAATATGRPKVLKFHGAYHGQHPIGVAAMLQSRPVDLPAPDPAGAGAAWVERDLLAAPFNDLAGTTAIVEAHASEIAAVIVEPLHRCLAPKPGFLAGLRELTRRHNIVLIFDEVVTGFRLAPGGAQEYYGVVPDLAAYGKALGGGFPLGACAGNSALMGTVSELRLPGPGYTWSASTTGGNPVSCAAALANLDVLSRPGTYSRLRALGMALRAKLTRALNGAGETVQVLGDGPLAQIAFSALPVTDQNSWLASDRARGRQLMLELVRRGVFLNPMGTKLYLSLAHDEAVLEEFVERLLDSLPDSRLTPG